MVLDLRLYRAAFVPVLLALIIAAFSLHDRPPAIQETLSADAFDGTVATRQIATWARQPALADRRPGAPGDDALATRVATALRANAFAVSQRTFTGRTTEGDRTLRAVVGERTGSSNRRIIVVAFRDSRRADDGSLADSATLVELAHVLGGRTLGRTVDLVSTSGREGGAGAADLADHLGGPVDAVLVLGDVAANATRRPWVVPFGARSRFAPLDLRRTVETAVRDEASADPGAPGFFTQFARLAFPLTLGSQGPLVARGVPAVQLGPDGERTDAGGFSPLRLEQFGRAALRTVTALDGAPPVRTPSAYLTLKGQVLPAWTVRLLVGALLLPLLFAAVDGVARVNRRRGRPIVWLRWVAAGIVPFVLAVLFLRVLRLTGVLDAVPPGPVGSGAIPIAGRGVTALIGVAVVLALGWIGLRPVLLRLMSVRGRPGSAGTAGAVTAVLVGVGILTWALNPFAAALLVPALHMCLLAVAPEVTWGRAAKLGLVALGLVPAAAVALIYALQFDLGPLNLLWMGALQVAGGQIGLGWALLWAVALGGLASAVTVVVRAEGAAPRAAAPSSSSSISGPGSYAGPGSLGGTESALRR
jgi:hypothetical protein